jgi:O-antigen/teichoic acid export membrane protein
MNRALLLGWAKISGGNIASGLLRLAALAIATRALGVSGFGIIVLIDAYVRVIDGLVNFQSVHVMTRFLTEAQHDGHIHRFRGLVKAGLLVDGATALLSFVVGIALLLAVGPTLGISPEWVPLAMLYCVVLLTRLLGVAEATFRCFDRYWAIGLRETISGITMVLGSLLAWWLQGGVTAFVLIWMFSEILANILFVGWLIVVLRLEGVGAVHDAAAGSAVSESRGFWPLLLQTNLTFGIRTLTQHGDLLITGALLGPIPAGLLRAAKNTAALLSLVGRPLQQVASAHITRLWSEGNAHALLQYTRNICIAAGGAGAAVAIIFIPYGHVPLAILFGEEFTGAARALAVLAAANAVYLAGVTLLPTMLTLGEGRQFLTGVLWGTAIFAIVMIASIDIAGIVGIALAHVAFNAVWALHNWRHVLIRIANRDQLSQ